MFDPNNSHDLRFSFGFAKGKEVLYYQFKGAVPQKSPEAFTAIHLLPAMYSGNDISLPAGFTQHLDPLFGASLIDIQHIFKSWNPDYKVIQTPCVASGMVAEAAAQKYLVPEGTKRRIATFFSGGVDSFYTFLKHREDITDLIFAHGLDISLEDIELREKTVKALRRIAAHFQVNLIEVETNIRPLITSYGEWGAFSHGVALVSIGLLLQNHFSTIYIPGSYTYKELFPWGTHPILDHLWSTTTLKFIHDGCEATRTEKVALIATFDIVLKNLRVCWQNPDSAYNCCRCPKCLRVMVSLEINNVLDKCTTFDQRLDLKAVSRLKLKTPNIRTFVFDSIAALEQSGDKPALLKALKKALFVRNIKKLIKKRYR